MPLLSVHNHSATQGAKKLFESITFGINDDDKIALIGINGSGKSTLLRQIVAAKSESVGSIAFQRGIKIGFLAQMPEFNPNHSIREHLDATEQLREHAWDYADRVRSILTELNITNLDQKMNTLSGGMVKKIALAQVFFDDVDLLILDEPTNHLDITTIEWVEKMLRRSKAALLMVTHDRYFLDKICNRILEIDQQTLFSYIGNYQAYLEQREARQLAQKNADDTIRSVLRVELEWLKRGPKARSTKQKARKQRIDDMLNHQAFSEDKLLNLEVSGRRLGKKILELKSVTKSFEGQPVISQFSYIFKQGEKIGILGPNGVGKTTLLNLITEKLAPDSGEIDVGVNTVFAYFDQSSMTFDLSMNVLEHVKQFGQYITLPDGTQLAATKLLDRFLFQPSSFYTPIEKLSGGERRRLHLVCLLLTNPNFLLFDEPTNDLDIQTLSVLEDFLLNFAGCVIVISHDRYFMDRVVDQLLIFKGKGKIQHFVGSYSDYADTLQLLNKVKAEKKIPDSPQGSHRTEKKKLTFAELQQMRRLEADIEVLESEKIEIEGFFSARAGSIEAYEAAGKRLKVLTEELAQKMAQWEALAVYA